MGFALSRRERILTIKLRELQASDGVTYNAFFAGGAAAHPDTLRITPGDILAAPFSTAPRDDEATYAALSSGRGVEEGPAVWMGVGTVQREAFREKRRHIAWILRMYVGQSFAGQGVGRVLLRALLARAEDMPGVAKVNLTVAAHNAGAVRLYASEGFRVFAREGDAFRDPTPRDELTMTRILRA